MNGQHTKRSPEFREEIDRLIAENLNRQWSGDREGAGIHRIVEILRNNTTDAGCVVRAAEDEPIFTLRAKDPCAANAIRAWIDTADNRDLHQDKIEDANICLTQFDLYYITRAQQKAEEESKAHQDVARDPSDGSESDGPRIDL